VDRILSSARRGPAPERARDPRDVVERVGLRRDSARLGPPPGPRDIFRGYRDTYLAPDRFLDSYFKALVTDPLAGLAWYASHFIRIARAPTRMPR
jgi:hypothetical protein